jgi:RNA polymerase sigma-54 factor
MESALDHLELLEKERFSEAAKKMNCSKDEARACLDLIKKLSPFPGSLFTAEDIRFVVPDIQIVRDNASGSGDLVIVLNNEVIPVLGINPFFKSLEPEASAGQSARKFAKENIREAKAFIHSLSMRNHTLTMVTSAILRFQRSFFEKGPQYLVPLTLGDIAGELGIHETTVSRAANGKYMQTEWGIFELRYFFTNSISGIGSGGSRFSKEGVKAIIQELIGAENESISDLDISGLLAQRGISLARRTVAKYRKELDLGSSYTR